MDDPSSSLLPLSISAGFPSPGVEWRDRKLDVNQLLGRASEGSYTLPMAGTALSGAGITDGDLLVFSPTLPAMNNDIILATVNGSLYIRRLVVHLDTYFLLPADLSHIPIRIGKEDAFRIKGVALCRVHALHANFRRKLRHRHRSLSDLNHLLGLDNPEIICTQVKGNSMQGSGIYDQDVLVIARGREAMANDIIIATLDGKFLVKRLVQVQETVFLLSENALMPPIIATVEQGFQVWGVVMASLLPLHQSVKQHLLARKKPSS